MSAIDEHADQLLTGIEACHVSGAGTALIIAMKYGWDATLAGTPASLAYLHEARRVTERHVMCCSRTAVQRAIPWRHR